MQHGSSKDKGKKITCNHLTFAPCKGPREPAIASDLRCENAACPLFLPRQREFTGRSRLSGITAAAGALPGRSTEARACRGVWALVKGMWCEGVGSRPLPVCYGWVLGAAPGARCTRRRGSRCAPERGPRCAQVSSPARGWFFFFSPRDPLCNGRASSREPAVLSASPATHGSSDEAEGSGPPRENSWE